MATFADTLKITLTLDTDIISGAGRVEHGHGEGGGVDVEGEGVGVGARLVLDATHVLLLADTNGVSGEEEEGGSVRGIHVHLSLIHI